MSDAASVPRSSCSPSPASAASRVSAPPARSSASPPPPSPEASSGAGGDKFDLKTARWRHKLDECIQKPSAETSMQRAERMFKTPYIVSIIVFFVALVLLLILRPPMVHSPGKTEIERGKLSAARIILWSLLAAILALFLPMVIKTAKK